MPMVIAHSELSEGRTCVSMGKGKIAKEKDIGDGCDKKSCFTCLARDNTIGYKSSTFDMNTIEIPEQWSNMRK
eukprot:6742502-Heterocapsa_arctica.AAC.1